VLKGDGVVAEGILALVVGILAFVKDVLAWAAEDPALEAEALAWADSLASARDASARDASAAEEAVHRKRLVAKVQEA